MCLSVFFEVKDMCIDMIKPYHRKTSFSVRADPDTLIECIREAPFCALGRPYSPATVYKDDNAAHLVFLPERKGYIFLRIGGLIPEIKVDLRQNGSETQIDMQADLPIKALIILLALTLILPAIGFFLFFWYRRNGVTNLYSPLSMIWIVSGFHMATFFITRASANEVFRWTRQIMESKVN